VSLAPSAGSVASAGDQPAASDRAWLEPGSEAAEGAVTRTDHALPDPARGPAHARPVAPAPVFQIGMQIAKAVPGRIDRLVVQLEPAALGRVEVRLKFHRNDQVSAVIAAERPDTLDALQRDARLLERNLQQAGLRLDSDGLTFSLKREHAHHQAREESWFAPAAGERADQPLLPVRDQPPPLHWFRGLRALDIRV
jgi:flagellar hook-length control protein FliK